MGVFGQLILASELMRVKAVRIVGETCGDIVLYFVTQVEVVLRTAVKLLDTVRVFDAELD